MQEKKTGCSAVSEQQILLENQVCFPLYSAANAVIRAYRPLLDKLDITYSQYLVLMVLWQQNGINVKDLGSKLHLDSGTLTPLLKRLEAKGMVERRRGASDERVRELYLTDAGQALKQQAFSVPDQMLCQLDFEVEELVALKTMCERIVAKLN